MPASSVLNQANGFNVALGYRVGITGAVVEPEHTLLDGSPLNLVEQGIGEWSRRRASKYRNLRFQIGQVFFLFLVSIRI